MEGLLIDAGGGDGGDDDDDLALLMDRLTSVIYFNLLKVKGRHESSGHSVLFCLYKSLCDWLVNRPESDHTRSHHAIGIVEAHESTQVLAPTVVGRTKHGDATSIVPYFEALCHHLMRSNYHLGYMKGKVRSVEEKW